MKDLFGKCRGRCKACGTCSEFQAAANEHPCGFCAHMPKDHVLLLEQPSNQAGVAFKCLEKKEKDAAMNFKISLQESNGRRLLVDGLSVHMIEAKTLEQLKAECLQLCNASEGRLLAGPHGPCIKVEGEPRQKSYYFRVDEIDVSSNLKDYTPFVGGASNVHTRSGGAQPIVLDAGAAIKAKLKASNKARRSTTVGTPSVQSKKSVTPPSLQDEPELPVPNNSSSLRVVYSQAISTSTRSEFLTDVALEETIGEGGEGKVYRGKWLSTLVAVKVFRGQCTNVHEECGALRKLRHPNIVQFFGLTKLQQEQLGIVLELCSGDLSQLVKRPAVTRANSKQPSLSMILGIIKDATAGLQYLHSKAMVHMDIKPNNILIQHGVGKLGDFGVTEMVQNLKDLTETSVWSGTPLYRAPELYTKAAPTPKADMWSMGLTLLEAMTGRAPYALVTGKNRVRMADGVAQKKKPGTLVCVGTNRRMYDAVIDFEPEKRMSAAEWLKFLNDYEL